MSDLSFVFFRKHFLSLPLCVFIFFTCAFCGSASAETFPAKAQSKELFIIDSKVPDRQILQNSVPEGGDVIMLKEDLPAVSQITDILSKYSGLQVIHLITHGSIGSIDMAGEALNSNNIYQNREILTGWGKALKQGGDFLLYGCNIAEGRAGKSFISGFAQIMGADVAASEDLTGANSKGGDWNLEYSVGTIESRSISVPNYQYTLQTPGDGLYTFKNATNNGNGTYTTKDGFFLISALNGSPSATSNAVSADQFGAYIADGATNTSGTSYIQVAVKNGGSFKISSSVIGDYNDSGSGSDNNFTNVYAVGYVNNVQVAITPAHNSLIFEANYNLDFSSFAGKPIDVFRVYYTWGSGTMQSAFNLESISISGASTTAPLSPNNNLSNLVLSQGTLSPAFATATTNYTSSVANSVTSLTLTPTVADATATVKVNGVAVTSGNASGAIALNVGSNTITVQVTAQDGSTKTYTVTVTRAAIPAPLITGNPANSTICVNSNTSYTISASNATSYQWQVDSGSGFNNITDGGVYSGATTRTLTITGATNSMNGYLYRCVASGATTPAANSNAASLTVNPSPAITTQPLNRTITAGAGTTFSVTATGVTSYQWQVNTGSGFTNLSNTSVYSGATTATLTLANTTSGMNGYMYRLVVNGACSPGATSNAVSLILRMPQTITFAQPPSKTYGDASFTLGNLNTAEGLPVTYTAADPTIVSISGNQATILKAGTTNITATQAGNDDYLPAEVTQSLVVGKRAITVRAYAGQFKMYGVSDPTFSYQVTSGSLVTGDVFSGLLSRIAGETVNNYAITQGTLSAGSNYELTFVSNDFVIFKRPVTVTANAGQSKIYGAADPAFTYQITSGILVNGDSFSGTLSRTAGEAVNSYAIKQGTLSVNSNYDLTFAGDDFTITRRPITVTADAGQTKAYGDSDPVFTYKVTSGNLVSGDTFTGTLSRVAGEAVNTYAINQGTLAAGSNYDLTYGGNNFTITKRPITVTANTGQTKVYGETDPVLTYQVTTGNLMAGDTFTGALSRASGEAVNTYAINQGTLTAGNNYELTFAGQDFAITKRAITVSANAGQTKVYGETDPVFSYQITAGNLVTGDALTGVLSRAAGEAANTYAITQGTLSAGTNYNLSYTGSNFSITKRAITVTANAGQTKVYGAADPIFTYQVTTGNLVTGDTFSGALSRAAGETVNAYVINQGTLTAGTNYELTYAGNDFSITKRTITVTANSGQTKVYGAQDPVFTYQVTSGNLATGDSYTGALSRVAGEGVNTYAINQGTLTAGNNYDLTFIGQDFAITKRAITVAANAGQTKIYGETDPVFTYQVTTDNLIAGDTFTGTLSRAVGETVNTYAITQGSLSAGNNYELTYAGQDFAITKRALTVTVNTGQTKVYGEVDPAFNYQVSSGNLITGDTFSGSLSRAPGEAVNTYAITKGTLSAGANYELTFTGTGFSITKRAITVTANAGQTKVYGATDPVFTYQVTSGNLVTGDTFSGVLSRAAGETVTTYAINQGTLTAGTNYELTYAGNDFSVTKRAITITANAGQSKVYGETDPVFTYQVTTGNLATGDTFTGALSRVAGDGVNAYAINQGTLTAGSNYDLTYAGQDFVITKRAITVTANAGQTKIYGETDPVFTYQVTTGNLVAGDTFTGALSRAVGEAVNTYAITQGTLSAGNNYELTYAGQDFAITKRALTVTVNTGQTKVYGETDPAFNYQVSSGNLITGDTFSGALSRASGEAVNTYAITQGTLSAGTNYEMTFTGTGFTITKRPITIIANAGQTKAFGEADPVFTYQITAGNLISGDTFSGALSRTAGETVNTYSITQGTLSAGGNYELTYTGQDFSITKRTIKVTANAGQTKVYGETDPVFSYQVTEGNLVAGDTFTGALSRAAGEDSNTYNIIQGTLSAGTNYTLTFTGSEFSINKRPLTITANSGQTKVYGESDPVLSYQITAGNLVTGDAISGALSRAAGEAVNIYAITQGTLNAGNNYEVTFAGQNFAITRRAITIKADAGLKKVYGESDPALTYKIVSGNLVGSDSFSGKLSRTSGENVGNYVIQQNTLGLNANYNLTYQGDTFDINKAALKITVDNKTRFVGTANPEFTVTYSGFVSGETPQILSALPVVTTEANLNSEQGEYPIVAMGAQASNYEIVYQNGILKIVPGAPKSVQLASTVVYENRPAGTAAGTLSSTSDDPTATFTYSLVSGNGDADNKAFTIAGNQLITASVLNYEAKRSYNIRVRSTTQHGFSLDRTFEVALSDVNEVPTLAPMADETICYSTAPMAITMGGISPGPESGQQVTLTIASDNAGLFEQLKITDAGKVTYQVKAGQQGTANVTVTVQDNGGTANGGIDITNRTFKITVNPLPVVTIVSDKGAVISKGETVQLTASGGTLYSWNNPGGVIAGQQSATVTVRPAETTTYRVLVKTAAGCSESKEFTIQVQDDYKVVDGTNLLSPNGDGVNDRFIIRNIDMYPNNTVKIFDRAGRLLYSKKNYTDEWDGTFQGSPLAEGTYYYIVDFGQRQLKGFITIVRN